MSVARARTDISPSASYSSMQCEEDGNRQPKRDNVSFIDGASPEDRGKVARGSGSSPGSYAVLAGGWYARRRCLT